VAPGGPAAFQADTDADALVRLDHLDQVRLTLPQGATTGTTSASFTSDGQPLVKVRLTRLPAGGAGPASTLPPSPTASSGAAPSAPSSTGGTGLAAGAGGPLATTLAGGAAVKAWPVPPGTPSPAIDTFLRREPP
ncbi:MAG TPA: hypothetical protein VF512_00830, partial [Actinomycetota bacterium]